MIRLLCDGCCIPRLYWGEEALAVDISEEVSRLAMHDPKNAEKINDWVFKNRVELRLNFNGSNNYKRHEIYNTFAEGTGNQECFFRFYKANKDWNAPGNRQKLDTTNDYTWNWTSPDHDIVTTIAATVKKYMNYDAYKEANSKEQMRLRKEIALRLWTPIKPYAEIHMDNIWSPSAYNTETMGSAHGIPVIEVLWKQLDQETIDQSFLSLTNSVSAADYINEPLTCNFSL